MVVAAPAATRTVALEATTRRTTAAVAGPIIVVVAEATITRGIPATTTVAPPSNGNRGRNFQGYEGYEGKCQICKKTNHIAKDCDWRYANDTSQKKKL